jgi:hypothetical protein
MKISGGPCSGGGGWLSASIGTSMSRMVVGPSNSGVVASAYPGAVAATR